jgi:hypothetical protein
MILKSLSYFLSVTKVEIFNKFIEKYHLVSEVVIKCAKHKAYQKNISKS